MRRISSAVRMRRSRRGSAASEATDATQTSESASRVCLSFGAISYEGRGHPNEDRVTLVDDLSKSVSDESAAPADLIKTIACVGVFDGHGGSACSQYLQDHLHKRVADHDGFKKWDDAGAVLHDAFVQVETEFCEHARASGDTSGSCAIMALVYGLDVTIAHAGDCRAVLKMGKKLTVTKDHRPGDPIERARIKAAGGFIKGGRIQGVLAPARSFGDLDIKTSAPRPEVLIATPDITKVRVDLSSSSTKSAVLVVASDGVWDAMTSEEAASLVEKSLHNSTKKGIPADEAATVAAEKLAELATQLNADDVSCLICWWAKTQ